jgi:hypothetical protein
MAIEKLVPRYLNLDDDPRLIKNMEMTDAINVRISATEEGTDGIIKNAFGNEIVPFRNGNNWQGKPHALPAGENFVISVADSSATGEAIYFVWNSNNDHSIYRFSTASNFAELVYRDAVLNFSKTAHIQADFVRNIDQNMLLYFTDGFSAPKKINVTVALSGVYSSVLNTGTASEKLQFLTVARMPPLDPPTYQFRTDTNYVDNLVFNKNFQFAYQYVYNDGEVSAISKYTDLAVAVNQYNDGLLDDAQESEYNVIRLTLKSSIADVKIIRVLARIGNEGSFFVIGEIGNPRATTVQNLTLDFYNDSTYRYISDDEQNKIYDAVPITAQAQTIGGNRLFYGNYVEGYDNTRTAAAIAVNYEDEPQTINVPVTISYTTTNIDGFSISNSTSVQPLPAYVNPKITIDLSGYTSQNQSSQLSLNFSVSLSGEEGEGVVDIQGNIPNLNEGIFFNWVELDDDLIEHNAGGLLAYARVVCSPLNISKIINIPANTSTSDILELVSDAITDTYNISLNTDAGNVDQGTKIIDAKSELAPAINAGGDVRRWMFFQGSAILSVQESQRTANSVTFDVKMNNALVEPKAIFKGQNIWTGITYGVNKSPNLAKEVNFKSSDSISIITNNTPVVRIYPDTEEINDPDGDGKVIVADGTYSDTQFLNLSRDKLYLLNSYCFINAGYTNYKSFKAGGKHSVGVVYYDDRGRTSFVQKIADAEVQWYSNRAYPYYGGASIDLRVTAPGPTWATRWAPVLRKTGNIDRFLQYSAINAYNASNPISDESVANVSNNDVIYVSMRSLEGKSDSFVNAKGALLDYKYTDGDKLRIVSYRDTNIAELTFSFGFTPKVGETYSNNGNTYRIIAVYPQGTTTKIQAKRIAGTNALNATGTFIKQSLAALLFTYVDGTFSSEKYIYPDVTFTVAGYENFSNNIDTNPILNEANDDTTYNTTGWFLVLEDNNDKSFNKQAIIDNTSVWGKDVIVEIYSRKEQTKEDVYYEIGKSFSITNGTHSGDARLLTNLSAYVQSVNTAGIQIYTSQRVYNGDIIRDNSNNRLRVTNVHRYVNVVGGSTYIYVVDGYVVQGSFSPGATFGGGTGLQIVNSGDAVVNIVEGDVYFRLRQLRIGKDAKTFNYLIRSVETSSVSDFYNSNNTSIGRPFAENPDAKRAFRTGSVTYSDPFLVDSYILGLSSFNLSKANFTDLNYIHGPIRALVNRDDSIVFLQEKKVGIFPVSRNIIESASGGSILTTTTDVVGVPQYYQGDYGVGNNPESVATERGRIYFSDIRAGKVIRLSQDGLQEISASKMDSFFKGKFRDVVKFSTTKRVIGGVDNEAGEFIVSSDGVKLFYVRIFADGTITPPLYSYVAQTDTAGTKVYVNFEYNDSVLSTFDTENRFFNAICDPFSESLNGLVFLDRLAEGFPLYLGTDLVGTDSNTVYAIATNSNFDFYVQILVNLSDGSFTFVNTCGSFDAYIQEGYGDIAPFTLGWDTEDSVWNSKYSFVPEAVTTLDDIMYSFKGGAMYKHSDAANRTTYYGAGSPAGSVVEVVSAYNPSMVKAYESISLEGTDAWAGALSNTDQSTSISSTSVTVDGILYPYGDYEKKERNFYAYVPRDNSANTLSGSNITNLSGTSEVYVLGEIASFNVLNITFTSPINDIPFPIGANLYKVSGGGLIPYTYNVTNVAGTNTIDVSSATNATTIGDIVVAISANSIIEGDQMRDYFMKIRLSNSNPEEVDLYAVNTVYAQSKLHNELGQ